jgi:hypothetical protein
MESSQSELITLVKGKALCNQPSDKEETRDLAAEVNQKLNQKMK